VVSAEVVRDMLGLADRAATIGLFEQVMRGETGPALESFRTLWGFGADPAQVMLDLLEHCHGASIAKAIGPAALTLPKDQAARLAGVGAMASAGTLARLWQMLLKAHDEVRRAPDPAAAAEMALIRLAYAADLPGPEEALKALRDGEPAGGATPAPSGGGGGGGGGAVAQARMASPQQQPASQPIPTLASFDDVLKLIQVRRDVGLLMDVQRFVRPISFRAGAIEFEPAPHAPADLTRRLAMRLKEWTGQTWLVATAGGGGAESDWERQKREERETRSAIEADPFVQSVMQAFPGAQIVEVRQLAAPVAPAAVDEVETEED
jgi:DNA polymerase-3 subunit gamma/tau